MLFFNKPSALIAAAALLAISATACGQAAKASTPSALAASPSDFDGQSVSVSGTAKSPATRKTRRGQMLTFQLCDTQCINVVEFGSGADATVAEGSTQSLTGTFHENFGRMRRMTNVLIVGGRPGGGAGAGNGGGAMNAGGATNAGSDTTTNSATNSAAPEASPT
jgi:hypothetical protein